MEGDDMEQINKCLLQCERTQIGEDDADMEYARQKIEVLTLRKGTLNLVVKAKPKSNWGDWSGEGGCRYGIRQIEKRSSNS